MADTKKAPGRPRKPAENRGESFSVRLLPAIRAQLELAATDANRSLCAEIAHRLQVTLSDNAPGRLTPDEIDIQDDFNRISYQLRGVINLISCSGEAEDGTLHDASIPAACWLADDLLTQLVGLKKKRAAQ